MSMIKAKDIFSFDEIRMLTRRSNAAGFWVVASTWGIIGLTFAVLARWPHPVTFLLALIILGGRQLALSIAMHEAAHRTLFESRFLNDIVADWLCARPVWADVARYRKHHLGHHAQTGTERDPDRSLAAPFPVSRRSLARKFLRDLTGISGVRRIVGLILMDLEILEYTVAAEVVRRPRQRRIDHLRAGLRHGAGVLLTNVALATVLGLAGHLWVYSAWVVAYLTTYSLFLRIRSLAEHACTEQSADPFRNTRTTRAGLLARITVAPLHVNYHIEHHFLVAVPYFRLPRMHRMLRERGALDEAIPDYRAVLAMVARS